MAVYINDTVNENTDCETPIPKVCGRQNVHMPTASCDTIHFTGVDDAEINQGQDFDPTEGVHAYDGNGEEIPFTVEPSEVDECQVGEIELEYTATGVGKKLLPKLCGSPNLKLPYCGVERKRLKRNLVIKGIAPPSIRGIERVCLDRETLFNPMDGVSAVDGNGNILEVSHSGTYDEVASGEIASFESIGGKSKSLKVSLEPIQNLHGYDKPWSGGAGKNKFPNMAEGSYSNTEVSASVNEYGKANVTSTGTGSVFVPLDEPITIQTGQKLIYVGDFTGAISFFENGVPVDYWTATGSTREITDITSLVGRTIDSVRIIANSAITAKSISIMLVDNSVTDYTYEPYSNICPISGHTEVDTHRTGVNLFDKATAVDGYVNDNTGDVNPLAPYKCTDFIKVSPNESYYVKSEQTNGMRGAWYDAEKNYVSGLTGYSNSVVTAPNNAQYARLTILTSQSGNIDTFAVNYPSTDHESHAYEGDTYHTELGRTVYGGTLDIVTGELVVDRAYIASYNGETLPSTWISDRDEYASGTTPTTGAQVVYELATPTTVQLTPQEVELLLGTNNVWSDGMVTVAYPANIPDGAYNYPFDGAYEITYHAEDECGNETTEVRQVIVSKSNSVCGARVCCATVAC